MPNRLATATSPYLLQHKDNPVDWWEWGPDPFEEAKRRDVPILLSVGYAACHWCHVMAHESFEDEATAAYLNEHFVAIKVDREERPDVDAVYMKATTAMTGQGGWPMTVALDHKGNPFFAGTYFPDQPRHGQASFMQLLTALVDAWQNRRDGVDDAARQIGAQLAEALTMPERPLGKAEIDAAIGKLADEFDPMAGGFGGAPKFPPSMVLELLRRYAADEAAEEELRRKADHMLARTTVAMAGSGMYDQIGGGFARYAVDRGWVVPHFEKMLYDNAQLLGLYARLDTSRGDRIAAETADFLLRELRTDGGGFASALDADSEGVEGKYYVWTPDELVEALGKVRGAWAAEIFEVTEQGTFEHGTSTLQLRHRPKDPHQQARLEEVKARLLEVRARRVRPARDDKIVAAWNGLAICGLVDAGLLLGRQEYVDAAVGAGELLADVHLDGDRLLRVSRDGVAGPHAGVLEDYGGVAGGFLALAQATADAIWLERAVRLIDPALDGFRAPDGGFFDTHADAESLIARPRDPMDNASPSGTSAMLHSLVTVHALTGEGRFRTAAEEVLAATAAIAGEAPRFGAWSLAAAVTMQDGPREVAVVGPAGEARDALADRARRIPGAVVVVADGPREDIPLLAGRTPIEGAPAAYVCKGFVCERPVTDPAELP